MLFKYHFFLLELKLLIDTLQQSYINSSGNMNKGWRPCNVGTGITCGEVEKTPSLVWKRHRLWVSVSRAADEVNTKYISVSIGWVALSFVNIHNRFAAFLQTHQPDLVIPCRTKYAQGQQASVGLWPGHICYASMLTHVWIVTRGQRSCRGS